MIRVDSGEGAPPGFGLSFGVMVLGIPVFLVGGALVRNAVVRGSRGETWIDELLESDSGVAILGVVVLAVAYPFIAVRRGLSLWPYALMVLGIAMVVAPMIYWAWWHGQLGVT